MNSAPESTLLKHGHIVEPLPQSEANKRSDVGGPDSPPNPLSRPVPSAAAYPLDALGDTLAKAARGIHDKVKAPLAICAQSVLAATNLATQALADIQLPNGQVRPISLFFLTIAESGERKSSSDQEALQPIRKREALLRENYELDLPNFNLDKLMYEKLRDNALKKCKGGRDSMRQALDDLDPPPRPPLKPVLKCSEPTFEGLFKILAAGQPSMGLFSTEGASFIGGYGMSDESKLRTAAGLSKLWDGEPIDRVRGGDGDAVLNGRRLAAHLMVQPGVADVLLSDAAISDQGLLSRMLIAAPDSTAGSRLWSDPPPDAEANIKRYCMRLQEILGHPLPVTIEKPNELEPPVLQLSQDARSLWIHFSDRIETQLGPHGKYAPIKSRANKMPEMAARIAATLTLLENSRATHVHVEHMQRGASLAEYYADEALRLSSMAKISEDLRDAQQLLLWLQTKWTSDVVSLPDIYQLGPHRIGNQAIAIRCAQVLEQHGYLKRLDGVTKVAGKNRRLAWRVIREKAS